MFSMGNEVAISPNRQSLRCYTFKRLQTDTYQIALKYVCLPHNSMTLF